MLVSASLLVPVAVPPLVPAMPPTCVFGCGRAIAPSAGRASSAPADFPLPFCRAPQHVAHAPPAPPGPGSQRVLGQHAALRLLRGRALCSGAARLLAGGPRYAREDVDWAAVEPRPGRFDWRATDEMFAIAARYGITILPILGSPPKRARGSPSSLPTSTGPWQAFVARAVARYGAGGAFWRAHRELPQRPARYFELFNEPYLPKSSGDVPDPARYARLVVAAVRAGRAANRQARFLIEAETTYSARGGQSSPDWLGAMFAAVPDLGRYFDAVAVHPYASGSPLTFTPGDGDRQQSRRLEVIHDALVARGAGDKHLWVTEVGWSTCSREQDGDCVSEADQAQYLRDFFALGRTRWHDYVDAVFVYALQDYRDTSHPKEGGFGVFRRDGSRKPAWYAVRAASRGAEYR